MSFLRDFMAGMVENAARAGDRQRKHAQELLEKRGDRMTDEQRAKAETYAYGDQPEQMREFAQRIRRK